MPNYTYYYFIYFSMQLLFMELMFTVNIPRKTHYLVRLFTSIVLYCIGGIGWVFLIRHIPEQFYYMGFVVYCFVFLVTLFMLKNLLDISWLVVWFIGTAGYATQHLTYSLSRIVEEFLQKCAGVNIAGTWAEEAFINIGIYLLIGWLIYWFITRKPEYQLQLENIDIRMLAISVVVLFVCTVLSDFYAHSQDGLEFSIILVSRAYAMISCMLSLIVQFDLSRQKKLESNNNMLEQLLYQERQQHEISKENIDIINRKCHDLKHQIQALENIDNQSIRAQMIDEMNKSIMIYDSNVQSGNDTLDLILTEKTLICQKYNIKFTYILDGKSISFIEVSDLYALFGNALDNAIERVIQEEEERRIISLNISKKNDMIHIHLENYCSDSPAFEDGLPLTTKQDKQYHGFGTRSIRYIVEKYHGFVEMRQDHERFILEILFS